jgi:ribosomal-protein-alanine N-acetyltransferase
LEFVAQQNMTLRLESVTCTSARLLSALHGVCFPEDPWDIRAIVEILGIPGFFGQMAWEEETPSGFALALNLGSECEILSLGVVFRRRRVGIGTALLDSICSEARVRGAESVALEVAQDNAAARSLYTKQGFNVVGHRRDYYCRAGRLVDALILRRPLTAAALAT